MPAYDKELFAPPAPLAGVTLRNPQSHATLSDVPMLLDSGADVTLIPQFCVDRLGATPAADQYYELMGFDGSTSLAPVVRLEMIFVGRTFKGQFLLIDQPWGVLGRNILNAVPLLLDGPRLTWSVSPTRQGAGDKSNCSHYDRRYPLSGLGRWTLDLGPDWVVSSSRLWNAQRTRQLPGQWRRLRHSLA